MKTQTFQKKLTAISNTLKSKIEETKQTIIENMTGGQGYHLDANHKLTNEVIAAQEKLNVVLQAIKLKGQDDATLGEWLTFTKNICPKQLAMMVLDSNQNSLDMIKIAATIMQIDEIIMFNKIFSN